MPFALSVRELRVRNCAIAFAALAASAISAGAALADSAFVTQAGKGSFAGRSLISAPAGQPPVASFTRSAPSTSSRGGPTPATPETTVAATGGNFASTLEMGRNNFVFQSQSGGGNSSNVGIFGGVHDTVGVFQKGQGLSSNLVLAGVRGLSVDVIQPPGTAPVDVLLARMPNGTVDLLQPKGAPAVSVFHVGNTLVLR